MLSLKEVLALIGAGVVIAALALTYQVGRGHGADGVQKKWDADRAIAEIKLQEINDAVEAREDEYRREAQRTADLLADLRERHAAELGSLRLAHAERLRDSEARADRYSRYAEGTAAEREHLARHAAELDRALEEGRLLVGELRSALGQRDAEAVALGEVIKAHRKLMGQTDES